MNRIIVIGNGFDLAHGFKTSYAHFMHDFWQRKLEVIKTMRVSGRYEDSDIQISKIPVNWISNGENYNAIMTSIQQAGGSLSFVNTFLQQITIAVNVENWVDIENEYYRQLKNLLLESQESHLVNKLNQEFLSIQNALIEYLKDIQKTEVSKASRNEQIYLKIFSTFKMKELTDDCFRTILENEFHRLKPLLQTESLNHIPEEDLDERTVDLLKQIRNQPDTMIELNNHLKSDYADNYFNLLPNNVLFLSFNYTSSEINYMDYAVRESKRIVSIPSSVVHIHGELDSKRNNPIIFGFGDELDEDYKKIENLDKNEYLRFIKSIKYLEKSNYRRVLEFINSDSYQVSIFGHSCGLSDRTLLNTLFEHNNCVSIKPYYYQHSEVDNYSDIVKNISRCFNNKALMRDKVVNKEYCESF